MLFLVQASEREYLERDRLLEIYGDHQSKHNTHLPQGQVLICQENSLLQSLDQDFSGANERDAPTLTCSSMISPTLTC